MINGFLRYVEGNDIIIDISQIIQIAFINFAEYYLNCYNKSKFMFYVFIVDS